jgi:hypothetical protein
VNFSLQWSRRALDALARIWVESPKNRGEISQAAATVDQILAVDPEERGESRDKGRRVLFVLPLVVTFRVDVDRGVVRVLDLREARRRGSG